ncbi:MAG: hypothetical protein AAF517_19860 [Planctomycetota bacterium]
MRRLIIPIMGFALTLAAAAPAEAGDRVQKLRERALKRHHKQERSHRHVSRSHVTQRCTPIQRRVSRHLRGHYGRHANVCTCRNVRIPGYHKVVYETVTRPGCYRKVWIPAQYEYVFLECGQRRRQLVRAGYYERVWTPGPTERVAKRIWVPARFETKRCRRHA